MPTGGALFRGYSNPRTLSEKNTPNVVGVPKKFSWFLRVSAVGLVSRAVRQDYSKREVLNPASH